jgi:1-acyl-sn-glycerol-3-phosphate acyltransferase
MKSHHEAVTSVIDGVFNFFGRVFTKITMDGPALDAPAIQQHPHMAVCTHRSHIDYYLAGLTLYAKGFKHMRFAAGDNLTKLPYIGPRFKAFGAFTVSREIAFERNYVKNLCNKVVSMMENHEAVLVFPEGGRSYTGATLDVKTGILGASVLLQAKSPQETVQLIPMAVSYEYPPDARFFNLLLKGKKLRKHSQPFLKRIIGNMFYFGADIMAFGPFVVGPKIRRTYGAAYIDYQEPVPVRSLVDIEADKSDTKDEFFAYRTSMQKLGDGFQSRFKQLFRLLPQHFLAFTVHENGPMTVSKAVESVKPLLDKAATVGANVKTVSAMTPEAIVEQGAANLIRLGAIKKTGGVLSMKKPSLLAYSACPVRDAFSIERAHERS